MSASKTTNEGHAPPRRWRWLVRLIKLGVFVFLLCAVLTGIAAMLAYDYITRPGVSGAPIRVDVPEGALGRQVGELLVDAGLIDHELFFLIAQRIDTTKAPIKAGTYNLPKGLSPLELLHALQEGPNATLTADEIPDDRKVTVPEGLSLSQTAKLFKDPEAFLQAASDPELLARVGATSDSLEGYLMPNTYFFDRPPTEREVVDRMVDHFVKVRDDIFAQYPEAAKVDMHKVLTVASLIEEEARLDDERPLVAAVIYNRLEQNMPLCFDSTLQFALGKYGQRMLDKDKEIYSPYNTYKYAGLPPGPISSPGKASILAALHPAEVKYIFFVSNADGKSHTFSETMAEHNRAVAQFRKDIANQRREQNAKGQNERSQ